MSAVKQHFSKLQFRLLQQYCLFVEPMLKLNTCSSGHIVWSNKTENDSTYRSLQITFYLPRL